MAQLNSRVLLIFFRSLTPYIGRDLRDVGEECQHVRVIERFQIKDVGPLPDMNNFVG